MQQIRSNQTEREERILYIRAAANQPANQIIKMVAMFSTGFLEL
jgi:hypothetical protein